MGRGSQPKSLRATVILRIFSKHYLLIAAILKAFNFVEFDFFVYENSKLIRFRESTLEQAEFAEHHLGHPLKKVSFFDLPNWYIGSTYR